ncbi:hypothetical protein [Candidatus Enterococcus mansonii]|uniref:Peptidase M50 domain-containing protein n=1 Tax=Candidatus Enterococcus mansonii TaxID=1834181 RepID=A0A242CFF2_9ENTE|nr:hypothetical protein [Enterococcus sp. 4G2_DIV0659]OTO08650.1 hypothetical protein A5880_001650 [Enterococcus sp. 4G2_DIV0659]
MLDVQRLKVQHVLFEYIQCNDDVYIFNTKNERMIKTTSEMIDYLETYELDNNQNDSAIDKFIFGAGKRKILEFKLKGFSIPKEFFSTFLNFMSSRYTLMLCKLFTLIGVILLPVFLQKGFNSYTVETTEFNGLMLFGLYVSQIVITMLHELGHYYYYQKYITSNQFRFGFLLRYFFLFMFYTNVNFMDHLSKRKQIKIMIAGVQTQLIISGILCTVMLFKTSDFLLMLFFLNLLNIFINLVPVVKTDGYWIINLLIGSEDYMLAFKHWVRRENKSIKGSEFLLAIFNVGVIICILVNGLTKIIQIFF